MWHVCQLLVCSFAAPARPRPARHQLRRQKAHSGAARGAAVSACRRAPYRHSISDPNVIAGRYTYSIHKHLLICITVFCRACATCTNHKPQMPVPSWLLRCWSARESSGLDSCNLFHSFMFPCIVLPYALAEQGERASCASPSARTRPGRAPGFSLAPTATLACTKRHRTHVRP